MPAPPTRARERRLPATAGVLAGVQFLVAAAGVMVLLGNGTVDGTLDTKDVVAAIGVAIAGAAVIGTTTSGGRVGWWFQLVAAPAVLAFGAVTMARDQAPGVGAVIGGGWWLLMLLLPPTRNWFLRDRS